MKETSFVLTNDIGWPIRGDIRHSAPGKNRRLVVISHGFKGFKDWGFFPYVARRLAENGFTTVTFNFSGNGIGEAPLEFTEAGRFGENSLSREIADLTLVLESAVSGRLPGLPDSFESGPALLGHSRGGLDSLVVAERTGMVDRVVTWSGVGSLNERFDRAMRADWRARGYLEVTNARTGQVFHIGLNALNDLESNFDQYDPLRVVRRLTIPLLIIHGTDDQTVPFAEARELFRAARPDLARLETIEGAGHTFNAAHPFAGPTAALERALEITALFLTETSV